MSTSAVSSSTLNQQLQQYFQTRQSDLQQLGQALGQGNLSAAQSAFNNIVSLGQNGPFPNGEPFAINQREQDFTNIGQALQSGDLAGAQQAFTALRDTFPGAVSNPISTGPNNGEGPDIVLNLSGGSGAANPEPITIDINALNGGGEQLSISTGNQDSNPITLNLGPNTNEQVVLNLLGPSSNSGSSSGLSVSA
jgi:hypothetical protein